LNIFIATGRRKSAIAQVAIILGGTGKITINKINAESYLQLNPLALNCIQAPLTILGLENNFDIQIKACGGGLKGQAQAIQLGIARSLCKYQLTKRVTLRANGFLTRDPRCKERKKYGLKKARKASQFSKR
jgi:small subunit ribosomal protein S9